jgi:hypothetical protein
MAPDPDEALSLLVESYHGEVWGEAIFGTMAELLADEDQRAKLRTLARLEHTMAGFLAPLVPGGAADEAGQRANGEATAKGLVLFPWSEFVGSIEPVTEQFLATYRRLGEIAIRPDWVHAAEVLVRHEQALREFAREEMAGRPRPTAAVDRFLSDQFQTAGS